MAGEILKRRRLHNAGRKRRRNMSRKQIKFFGTKRQKAALRNRSKRRRNIPHRAGNQYGVVGQLERTAERAIASVERAAEDAIGRLPNRGRSRNVGEILTVLPANPGRKRRRKNMAATRTRNRRKNRTRNRARNRGHRRARPVARRRRNRSRTSNPKVIVRYRNRRSRRHNRGHRRRNQGISNFLAGDAGKVVGVLGGATVTSILTGFLPANWKTGVMGYITTGIVAVVAGNVAGRAFNNKQLGNWMTIGGLLIVGLQLLNTFFPGVVPLSTTGMSGMGLLTSSNFFVPQVNLNGSMASFVTPAGIPAPVVVPASGMNGLGAQPIVGLRSMRRVGRLR